MLKKIIGGVAVGLANIIPGVSGGTMLVILGLFNDVMSAISGLFSIENKNRKDDFLFLLNIGLGAIIGLVVFAKILDILFINYPIHTMICFVGMVFCSVPSLLKKEIKIKDIKYKAFIFGFIFILLLESFSPESNQLVVTNFPSLSFVYLLVMFFAGFISGGAMFVPGVSGSMLLMITGQYYLFKSLLSNVTTFDFEIIIPLGVMAFGILFGIIISSKITGFCLKKYHDTTMSFLLGLVIASGFVLFPYNVYFDFSLFVSGLVSFLIGGFIIWLLEQI